MAIPPFSKQQVSVTMSGEEWVALIARVLNKPLSKRGEKVYQEAQLRLTHQLREASKAAAEVE